MLIHNPRDLVVFLIAACTLYRWIPIRHTSANGAVDLRPGMDEATCGSCVRCRTSWKYADAHPIHIANHLADPALCQACWKQAKPLDRVSYVLWNERANERSMKRLNPSASIHGNDYASLMEAVLTSREQDDTSPTEFKAKEKRGVRLTRRYLKKLEINAVPKNRPSHNKQAYEAPQPYRRSHNSVTTANTKKAR